MKREEEDLNFFNVFFLNHVSSLYYDASWNRVSSLNYGDGDQHFVRPFARPFARPFVRPFALVP
jgi:hypothetical protein